MFHAALSFLIGTVARALVLMAFSEFVFFNEGPVIDYLAAEGVPGKALYLAEFGAYYGIAGALLLVLEPWMTTWWRVILCGAFVGWSIEAAMVPVAYENVPFSYFWPSVGWHAVVDVALGWVVLRRVLAEGALGSKVLAGVLLGVLTAVHSTWVWGELSLTPGQFAQVMVAVVALLIIGFGLAALPISAVRSGRIGFWVAVAINLLFGAIWAIGFAPMAAGLVVLGGFTGWVIWMSVAERREVSPAMPVPVTGFVALLLALPCAAATFWLIAAGGYSAAIADLFIPILFVLGFVLYLAAVGAALWSRRAAVARA